MQIKQPRKERRKSGRNSAAFFVGNNDNVLEFNYKKSSVKTNTFIKPCTKNQREFITSIKHNKFTFGIGMAGCGKTLLSLFEGIRYLNSDETLINKIYYIRANIDGVDEESSIGALPGEFEEKMSPLAAPIYDSCREFMSDSDAKALFQFGKIEVLPLAYLRGRSFANSFVIVDEAQNLTVGKLKTAITRLSHDSRMVLVGDPSQCDLKQDQKAFLRASQLLHNDEDIGVIYFSEEDCMREGSLGRIVRKLEKL